MPTFHSARLNTLSAGKETTWGVAVPTTALIPQSSFDGDIDEKVTARKIKTGSRANAGTIKTGQEGKLSISYELDLETIGYLLKAHLNRESVTGAGPYTHTFDLLNNTNLTSWTFKLGRGGYKYTNAIGAVNSTLSLDVAQDSIITGQAEFMYQDEVDTAISLLPAAVTIATDVITATQTWALNDIVRFYLQDSVSVLPAPLVAGQDYYVNTPTGTSFKVALSSGGAAIDLTTQGTGVFEVVKTEMLPMPTNRAITYGDSNAVSTVKVNAANFPGYITNFSYSGSNNPGTFKALGLTGKIAAVLAGAYDGTGKFSVLFNADSKIFRDKLTNNGSVSLQFEFWEDANQVLRLFFPAVTLKGGKYSEDDTGIVQDFEFTATGNLATSPITATLINNHAGLY